MSIKRGVGVIFNTFLAFYIISCREVKPSSNCHITITVKNNSNKNIRFTEQGSVFQSIKCNNTFGFIPPNGSDENYLLQYKDCWEDIITKSSNYNGKMTIYFIEESTLLNSCDSVKLNSNVLEKRFVTLQDLQKDNWIISYPK